MYRKTAMGVQHQRMHVSLLLAVETSRRACQARPQSTNPRVGKSVFQGALGALIHNAMKEGGYCLDAPDQMPAGSCFPLEVGDGALLPAQAEVERG